MRASLVWSLLTGACAGGPAPEPAAPPPPAPAAPALPPSTSGTWPATLCEPSAVVWSPSGWLVGDNEIPDRLLRLDAGMVLSGAEALPVPVEDIEALAAAGDVVVASHGRTKKGKGPDDKPARYRVLVRSTGATARLDVSSVPGEDGARLIASQGAAPGASTPPLDPFNIEGAAVRGVDLLLGLRGPLDARGHAMVLVSTVPSGAPGIGVGRVLHLDLGGEGVRELTPLRDGLLVLSGPAQNGPLAPVDAPHHLWWWPDPGSAPRQLDVVLPPSTEGAWPIGDGHLLVVIDGIQGEDAGGPCAPGHPGRWQVVPLPALPSAP